QFAIIQLLKVRAGQMSVLSVAFSTTTSRRFLVVSKGWFQDAYRVGGKVVPRYFFNVVGSHELTDPSGIICRDDRSATAKAERIANGFAKRGTGYVVVFDSADREIARVVIP